MRVGIVGAGTMGEVHALAWRTSGAELTGCTSANRAQSQAMAERYKVTAYADFADLVNNVDLVDICTPTPLHKQMVVAAAKLGKHVICEKPIAMTLEDAHAMVDACDAAGVRFFVGMVVRFFPQYRLVKELVAKGQIGQLEVLRLKRVAYVPHKPADNWYIDETRSGGMVVDLMIHDFDYARWLAGEVERVFARRSQSTEGPAQYVQAIIRFRSGAMALVEGGWAYPAGVFRTGLDVSGTDGLIEWSSDQPAPIQTFFPAPRNDAEAVGLPVTGLSEDPFSAEIRHAYEAIRTGEPFEVTAADALEALRIALAVRESLTSGKPVDTAGLMLMTLSNGVQASIDCSWSRPARYPRWGHLKLDVVGERGAAVTDCFAQHVTLYARDALRNPSWIGFGSDPNQAMIDEFVDSIRSQREPCVSWNDGYQALRVALAAYESARIKQPVKVEHPQT